MAFTSNSKKGFLMVVHIRWLMAFGNSIISLVVKKIIKIIQAC